LAHESNTSYIYYEKALTMLGAVQSIMSRKDFPGCATSDI